MGHVSVAVGCAVGIPVGLSVLIALVFWIRMQRRYKKEDVRDRELEDVIRDESGFISFDNLETWQDTQQEKKDFYVNDESVDSSGNHVSSSSEQLQQPDETHYNKHQSRHYVPAYRRNLNAYRIRQLPTGVDVDNNGSNLSLDSTQNIRRRPNLHQENVYDQMIPVLANTEPKLFSEDNTEENTAATIQQNHQTNEKIIMKNLRNNNFGSYPRRTHSMTSLSLSNSNSNTNTNNASRSSLHTRSSSVMSAAKGIAGYENVFDTPKSTTATSMADVKDSNNQQQVYSLKNNYDIKNTSEIQEEDQYENEFTNYSESKRAFIDSLRPKPGL
ncbi:suppressor of lethality of KEX2 GAS1 double null mutant protein 1 [Zygosaccharomyces mellis]|uniref:Suppressor of lethality of KEX2 GAS1 double null mutant protein 1 n=1 Tax=Zygosaccharomyces mellis TaxID=42258 RepID=A0A4C2EAV0_9SACH|nr:suppressor of lethality of KEX2 GAS1 double null mutant protein 1 [Zygosaccharomyces mellis]